MKKLRRDQRIKRKIERLEDECDRYREALERIDAWARAYPLSVFPEPDLTKAAEVLAAAGLSLDSISAHAMRHVIEVIGTDVRAVLQDH